jgi:light-regulated signal transduction histidine kinase (bacteriophytochrome)
MPDSEKYRSGLLNQEFIEAAELTAIIESIPDALYIGDLTGIKRSNKHALDMLGFDSVQDLNQHIGLLNEKLQNRDAKTGRRLRVEEEPFVRALRGETVVHEVITTHIKTNKEIIVRCAAAPVILNGEIIGAIAINSDITEEIKNKALIKEALENLSIKNEELDKFVYTTSHDLKAPLISIGSLIDIIKQEYMNKPLGEEGLQILEMASEKVNHLNDFIHSLLDSAKNQKQLKELIDLNKVLAKVIRNLNIPSDVQIFIKHNLPQIKYHKVSIMQVLQNIVSNAVKYMDKPEKIIKIGYEESADKYTFCISDNGIGIKRNDLDKIFDKFGIVHKDPTIESSGLGLSIVKEIIEKNRGHIWVDSEIGKGSTFYFTIGKEMRD